MYWLFWAIYQIKKGYGTSFYCRFSAYLFLQCFLSNTLLNDQVLIFEESGPVKTLRLESEDFRFKPH